MCCDLEAVLVRRSTTVLERRTLRWASMMLPYLQHYAERISAYMELEKDPTAYGFFVPSHEIKDFEYNGYRYKYASSWGLSYIDYMIIALTDVTLD